MYDFIRGKLAKASPTMAVLDVGGVGYKILIPASAFGELHRLNEVVTLFVSLVTRDTGTFLCGFLTSEERDLFEIITNISGIGPKTALNMLGHLSIEELHHAVASHDVKTISRVPGIGKKTAERFIVEMQGKSFSSLTLSLPVSGGKGQHLIGDAMRALVNLGYNQIEAQRALKQAREELPEEADLTTILTHSLRFAQK